jgi:beta-lactam-binding protein with PASTA domain
LERLVDNPNGSPANTTGVSDRPVAEASSSLISPTTGTSSVSLPSRSQRRHAAAEESFERSLLLLLVLFALLGGSTIIAEVTVSHEAPVPLLEVPNLNGARSLQEAQEMAGENFVVEGVPVESGEPVGTVVSQDPKPGETADEGAPISVRVSGRQIEVLPDVEGKTIEEARQSIRSRPFSLEVTTVESSSREIGRVLGQDPKGGDGVTAEAGTHVTVTVGGGPSAAKVPDLRDSHPEEPSPMPGDQTGIPNDRGSEGRNVEQRPSAGTEVEPEDPVVNAEEPGSDLATVSSDMGHNDQEGFASDDYASWLGESGEYEAGQYESGQYDAQ